MNGGAQKSKPRILVVDDDDDMRTILRAALSDLAVVSEAADGETALRLIREERPRAVLLDLTMPGMGGLEVLREALLIAPGLPVLMLTGRTDIDSAHQALASGAREYITKPFDPTVLRDELLRLIADANDEDRGRPWRVRA